MTLVTKTRGALFALSVALSGCAAMPTLDLAGKGKPAKPVELRPVSDVTRVSPGVPSEMDIALHAAESQRKAGDLDAATRTLSQMVLIAPDDARVLSEYGKTLLAKGEIDDALAFLIRATELQPNDWSLYSAQGVAYDQKGNYAAAQFAYSRALTLKPGEPTVLSNAGLSRMQAGDLDSAEILFEQAVQSGASHPRIAQNLALLRTLRGPKPAAPAPTAAAEPAPAEPVVSVPPPAPVAQAPIEEAVAQTASAPAPTTAETPAASEVVTEMPTAAPQTGVAALRSDPTVVMQAIPKEEPKPRTVAATPRRRLTPAPRRIVLSAEQSDEGKVAAQVTDVLKRLSPTD